MKQRKELSRAEGLKYRLEEIKLILYLIKGSPLSLTGLLIVIGFVIFALVGSFWTPHNPLTTNTTNLLQPPSLDHLFGTDELGRDVFSRVMAGGQYTLRVAGMVTFVSLMVGSMAGLIAGWFGGRVDDVLMRVADMFLSLPSFLLAMTISAALGPSLENVMIAIIAVYWPAFARLMRSQTLSIREKEYVEAARQIRAGSMRIMFYHIFPNAFPPILIYATLVMGIAIIVASSLSFLGFGAQPPIPEWGLIVASARIYFETAPWYALLPGVVIVTVVLGFNLLGDGLRDALDPRLRKATEVVST